MCGGGGFNPISVITDPISEALGTDGGGGGLLGGLEEVDKFVGREVPGGWVLPAAIAAAYATGYIDPSLFATEAAAAAGAEAGAGAIASEAGQAAFFEALASGATSTEAVSAGLAADSLAVGGAGAGALADSTTGLGSLTDPSLTAQIGGPTTSGGTFGSISAPLEGSGAIPGAGATTLPGGGLTGALPANVMVGDGTLGTTMGATYMSAGPGQFAVDALGNAIPASSVGIEGFAPTSSLSLSDASNAIRAANAAKGLLASSAAPTAGRSLTGSSSTGTSSGVGSTAVGSTAYGSPKATFVQGQQIAVPGLSPYQPAAEAGANSNLDVSPVDLQLIQQAKTGGMIHMRSGGDLPMTETRMRGRQFAPYRANTGLNLLQQHADGGQIQGHNPSFFSPGGLASMENTYVNGEGDGTSDSVEAMLADGEFVIPADVVSKLGNGSSNAGAKVLDNFLLTIREHAQKHDPKNLPPDSRGALAYLLDANKKVRA